jgi:Arc/MetJ-type ribon-helix-helix transcriptional regulator
MAKGKSNTNADILRYALTHLEEERQQIQSKIDHINSQLGKKVSAPAAVVSEPASAPHKKRTLNAAARRRISAAQKKRWAEHRKAQAKAAKAA